MPSKKDPVFRKAVIPWYRSSKICVFIIVFMLVACLFGIAGISVAQDIEAYRNYIWVPSVLVAMSALIIVTTTYRLIKRYVRRRSKDRFLF
jgi:uncharacterized membrane protein